MSLERTDFEEFYGLGRNFQIFMFLFVFIIIIIIIFLLLEWAGIFSNDGSAKFLFIYINGIEESGIKFRPRLQGKCFLRCKMVNRFDKHI